MASSVVENEDLLTEILLRLPAKTLMRLKCVCKQWLTLISNPHFCRSHTLRPYQTTPRLFPSSLLLTENPGLVFPILPLTGSEADSSALICADLRFLNVPNMSFDIIQSCNGLLLVEGTPLEGRAKRYFVCNPTTKQFIALTFPGLAFLRGIESLYLAFDPLKSPHFKVVSIQPNHKSYLLEILAFTGDVAVVEVEIKVYSSETGCWSDIEIDSTIPLTKFMVQGRGIYCNGAIHWCMRAEESLYFDVGNQCLKTYPMPNIGNREVEYFGESGGRLHMILLADVVADYYDRRYYMDDVCDILELKEDYSGWFVRFHVDLNCFNTFTNSCMVTNFCRGYRPLCIIRQEKEEDSMLLLLLSGRVMSVNLLDHTFRELSDFNFFMSWHTMLFVIPVVIPVFQYFENLSWVGASAT